MVPLVLHHGLFGFGELRVGKLTISNFRRIDRSLVERGHPLIIPRVHPTGGIVTRARQLKENILRQLAVLGRERERVVILAYSLGGLDARYMVRHLGMADRVAAIVTMSTPHRGSPYADWCVKNIGRRLGGLQLMNKLGLDVQGISDLTLESCRCFNERVPDAPQVRYFSVSAARPAHLVPPFLLHSHHLIRKLEGENDGLVSVSSATWGQHLATWPADHLHVINRRLVIEIRRPTGDISPYYLRVLEELEREGVC
jgi:triacylglycerol lipase